MNMNCFKRLPLYSVVTEALPEYANIVNELSSNIEEQPDVLSHIMYIVLYV